MKHFEYRLYSLWKLGENPTRTRRCNSLATRFNVTEKLGRLREVMRLKSEDLPKCVP